MNLQEAKSGLFTKTFLLGRFKQNAALKYLSESNEPGAIDILVEALDQGHRSRKIKDILLSVEDQARLDHLWGIWSKSRSEKLENVLKKKNAPASDETNRVLSLLKIGNTADIPTDNGGIRKVLSLINDPDKNIKKGVIDYAMGLPRTDEASDHLYRTWIMLKSPMLGAVVRDQKRTLIDPSLETIDILLIALEKGYESEVVSNLLLSVKDPAKTDHLWATWSKSRSEKLENVLKKKNAPASDETNRVLSLLKIGRTDDVPRDRGGMRKAFQLLGDRDKEVQKRVVDYASLLPRTEDAADEIYGAWLKFESEPLASVIRSQDQKPSNPSLEALFFLLENKVKEYLTLENERGERFQEAFAMAPESFREKLNNVVLKSGSRRLTDAYEKAMAARGDLSSDLVINARKTAGDDNGLFEAAKYMTLTGLLDLCKRWTDNKWRPTEPRYRALVERAVTAYTQVGDLNIATDTPAPEGTVDLFDAFQNDTLNDKQILEGLDDPDPFIRMRSVYLGVLRNLLPAGRLEKAAQSQDWPERLAAKLSHQVTTTEKDPVTWVNGCTGSGGLLTAPVNCTPEEYDYFGQILHKTPLTASGFAAKYRALTEILHAFQSVHAAGGIVAGDDDSAMEPEALQMTEVEDAPDDIEF
jgi:hypothetical protein